MRDMFQPKEHAKITGKTVGMAAKGGQLWEENLHEISGVAFWSVDLLRFAHVFSVSVSACSILWISL